MREKEDGERTYHTVERKIKGVNIPASTLHRMQLPEDHPKYLKPSQKTIDKLSQFYHRVAYNRVRRYGGGIDYAKKASRYEPGRLNDVLANAIDNAKRIAQARNVPVEYVLAGLAISRKFDTQDDLDRYMEEESIDELTIHEKRKTYKELSRFPKYNKSKKGKK